MLRSLQLNPNELSNYEIQDKLTTMTIKTVIYVEYIYEGLVLFQTTSVTRRDARIRIHIRLN